MSTPAGTGATRRRSFTLPEVILAATFGAMVCTAGMMLIQSINNTAATTSGLNDASGSARDAIAVIDMLVEQAALIGYTDGNQLLIWRNDDNQDGQINLSELTLVRYDATAGNLDLMEVHFPAGTPGAQNVVVSTSNFCSLAGTNLFRAIPTRRRGTWSAG